MIDAWLSWSEMTASRSSSSASKTPPFASKHEPKRIVSSVPRNAESRPRARGAALRAADEPDRRHPVAPPVERLVRRGDHLRVVRKAEIVVRAEVEQLAALRPRRRGRPAASSCTSSRLRPSFSSSASRPLRSSRTARTPTPPPVEEHLAGSARGGDGEALLEVREPEPVRDHRRDVEPESTITLIWYRSRASAAVDPSA